MASVPAALEIPKQEIAEIESIDIEGKPMRPTNIHFLIDLKQKRMKL